jgi:OOP family OmpA-OmpF porin
MNLKLRSRGLLLCLGLGLTASAQAAEPGWYIVGFGGESSASGSSQDQMDANLVDIFERAGQDVVSLTSSIDDSDTGIGLAGGYQLNDHFAMEFAYVDLGSVDYRATATVTDGVDQADADVSLSNSASGPVLSAMGILPIGERFSVYGRIGLSLMTAKGTARITLNGATDKASQSSQKTDPVYGIGAEFSLSRNFAVRLAWDRYPNVGTQDVAGDIDADLYSLGIRMGLAWFR